MKWQLELVISAWMMRILRIQIVVWYTESTEEADSLILKLVLNMVIVSILFRSLDFAAEKSCLIDLVFSLR